MQKRGRLLILGTVIVISIVFCFLFDNDLIRALVSLRNPYLSELFLGVRFIDTEIIVAVLLTGLLLWKKEKREWILPVWATFIATAALSIILKYTLHRNRPFVQGIVTLLPGLIDKASYHLWDFSFPSFDTALVFSAVPIVSKFFPKFKYIWIAFACLVGISRVYFGVHFPSDVISGGAIGYLIGFIIVELEERHGKLRKLHNRLIKLFKKN